MIPRDKMLHIGMGVGAIAVTPVGAVYCVVSDATAILAGMKTLTVTLMRPP